MKAIAHQAIERRCGARGLRAIIENVMLDTMFELPGLPEVTGCVIDENAVNGGKPRLIEGIKRKSRRRAEEKGADEASEQPALPEAESSVS